MLIIPAIDIIEKNCVRLTRGNFRKMKKYKDTPFERAKKFVKDGAFFIHIIDLDGAKKGKLINADIALEIAQKLKIDVQYGGGIRNYEDAKSLLKNGIKRLIFGSAAIFNISFIKKIIDEFGEEKIAVSIDLKNDKIFTDGWQKSSKKNPDQFLKNLKKLGVTTIIYTDINRDGMLSGPNFSLAKKIIRLGFKVIAAGGISKISDIEKLKKIGVDGVIIGKALYEGKIDLREAFKKNAENFLAKRIIPCLDMKNGRVVKGTNFVDLKDAGDPVELAKYYSKNGADELVFLDIMATFEKRDTLYELVRKISENINIPFTVGGGVKDMDDIKMLLRSGADKVSIGSYAVKNPDFVRRAADKFGSQCIVISIDPKKINGKWLVFVKGGRENTFMEAIKFAKKMEKFGAGELLVNSLDRDGMKSGYDIKLLREISANVNIPIIASSGAGAKEDFLEAFKKTNVDAALAASLFHFGEIKIPKLKQYLFKNNVNVRI